MEKICDKIIGMTKENAELTCKEYGYFIRVISEGKNKNYMITMDCQFKRVNIYMENNLIHKAYVG